MTVPLQTLPISTASSDHGVQVSVTPALENRNRLTCAFRLILAIPHLMLVGGPVALGVTIGLHDGLHLGGGGGVLGVVAGVASMIAWFAIVFIGVHPRGLWELPAFYLRWRVRAIAYASLLRDEYPPFGDADYPAHADIAEPSGRRNRLTVAFRVFLLVPHFIVLWILGVIWCVTTIVAWFAILFTGRYPRALYGYGVGVLRWGVRVEAYLLLLHDEYPPFDRE